MRIRTRWRLVGIGLFLLLLWVACWAMTAVPGSGAIYGQWFVGNALALLAGVAIGMAVKSQ